jgi:hypothetical protein
MNNIIPFPERTPNKPEEKNHDPLRSLKARILKRFNVTYLEYIGAETGGKRTLETQAKIDRAMQKETLQQASKFKEELDKDLRIDS